MSSNIFLIGRDRALTELSRSPYDSEELLQALIADHPAILGAATGSDGGLLLVRREYAVPDAQDGYGRWSLEHLFLDRNAVPILVEVKRATDTRARREVVAQMLDYSANAVAYWPIDGLVEAYRVTLRRKGPHPMRAWPSSSARLSQRHFGGPSKRTFEAVGSEWCSWRTRLGRS